MFSISKDKDRVNRIKNLARWFMFKVIYSMFHKNVTKKLEFSDLWALTSWTVSGRPLHVECRRERPKLRSKLGPPSTQPGIWVTPIKVTHSCYDFLLSWRFFFGIKQINWMNITYFLSNRISLWNLKCFVHQWKFILWSH